MIKPMMVPDKCIEFIKQQEGLMLDAYSCSAGKLTIGYGHTGPEVFPSMKITRDEAHRLLLADVDKFAKCVNDSVKVPLTENQFSALVSFAYNCGCAAFKSSTLLRKINEKDFDGAVLQFRRWVYGSKNGKTFVIEGLKNRREAEIYLFTKKTG